jgi:hypothetical protein
MMKNTKFDILFEEIISTFTTDSEEVPLNCCEICKQEITDTPFSYDDFNEVEYSHICLTCAEKLYDENKDAIDAGEIEIHTPQTKYDNWRKCESCESLYPESELKDTNHGMLCDWCIEGDLSHGVELSINY